MLPSQHTNREHWAIVFGYLLDFRSDEVVRSVSRSGLIVDWTLTEREAYSHSTRVRAYAPRIQAAFDALQPDVQAKVLAALSAEVIRLHPRSDELQAALARVNIRRLEQAGGREFARQVLPEVAADARRVFVVHGRDTALRESLFGLLRAFGIEPIEWSEAIRLTGRAAPYIGEVLDVAFNNAQAIVVLLSPDDEVRLSAELQRGDDPDAERQFMMQPRPNVLFEAGMGFGRNPDRTLLVQVGSVKNFSDIAGRHVVRLTNEEGRRRDLAERLITAGCTVSLEDERWKRTGDFAVARVAQGRPTPQAPVAAAASSVKWVDLSYPHDSRLQAALEADGYIVRWSTDSRLARRLDIEGWSLVTEEAHGQRVVLKVRDRPEDQTLIKKKNVLGGRVKVYLAGSFGAALPEFARTTSITAGGDVVQAIAERLDLDMHDFGRLWFLRDQRTNCAVAPHDGPGLAERAQDDDVTLVLDDTNS